METPAAAPALKVVQTPLPEVYPGEPVSLAWKRMAQLKIENPGITNKELAKALGVNAQTIYCWEQKLEYQQYEDWCLKKLDPSHTTVIERKQKEALVEARDRFQAKCETYLDEMQERLFHIMRTTDSEKLQVEIIQDTLDRMGHVSKKAEQRATPIIVTPEAMNEFLKRATEAGLQGVLLPRAIAPDIIDAETVETD